METFIVVVIVGLAVIYLLKRYLRIFRHQKIVNLRDSVISA